MSVKQPAWPRLGPFSLALICAAALQACGGGSGSSDHPDTTQATHSTVAAYGDARASGAITPSPDATPSSEDAGVHAADALLSLAMDELSIGLSFSGTDNVVIVPALTAAHFNGLLQASSGETLAALLAHFPDAPQWASGLNDSHAVTRQVWSQQGAQFLLSFLRGTDLKDAGSASVNWQGREIDLAKAPTLPGVEQTLQATHPNLSTYAWDRTGNSRMVLVDSWRYSGAWPQPAATFDGIFKTSSGDGKLIPMIRITEGVTRHSEAAFTANAITLGGQTILAIVPSTASLRAFVDGAGLTTAIEHTVAALLMNAQPPRTPTPGELILPVQAQNMSVISHSVDRGIFSRNAGQVYDEVNANLKGLDGTGGTYAKPHAVSPVLTIGGNGLSMQAASETEFIFSPRNRFYEPGPGGSYGVVVMGPDTTPACPHAPDLQSFFLVILDAQHRVTAIAAIGNAGPADAVRCLTYVPYSGLSILTSTDIQVQPGASAVYLDPMPTLAPGAQ